MLIQYFYYFCIFNFTKMNKVIKNYFKVFQHSNKIKKKEIPFQHLNAIFICPSHECNANCIHCYEKYGNKTKASLTTDEVKNIVDQFRLIVDSGTVYYCSGEFLLRPDAIELVRYASNVGLKVVVVSNGLLADSIKIEELKKSGLTWLIISLDSANEIRHDESRGVKGCYKKAVNALQIAKEKGLKTQIWTYITKTNFNELFDITKLARKVNTDLVLAFFPILSGQLFNRNEENLNLEEREFVRKQFSGDNLVEFDPPAENRPCKGGGNNHICVMPTGEVTFCPTVPYSYGNIHLMKLDAVLKIIAEDYNKFCNANCTGQCIMNFEEYRNNCNAKFLYE